MLQFKQADDLCITQVINDVISRHSLQSACVNLSRTNVNAQHQENCIIDKLSILHNHS